MPHRVDLSGVIGYVEGLIPERITDRPALAMRTRIFEVVRHGREGGLACFVHTADFLKNLNRGQIEDERPVNARCVVVSGLRRQRAFKTLAQE